jgi:hypothetical protein
LTLKTTSFFLAAILSAAAPAFADKISAGPRNDASLSHHTQQSIHGNGSPVRFDSEKTKIAEVVLFTGSHPSAGSNLDLFSLGSNIEDTFGEHSGNSSWKHKLKGHDDDGLIPSVSVPEPASQILLLFGLAGVGILFFRRNSLKKAI